MTGSKRRVGLRRGRAALLGAVAASAVLALGVSSAQATTQPVTMTFTDGALKLGGSANAIDIVGTTPVTWNADVCTDNTGGCATAGDFTVTPANFSFTPFSSEVTGFPGLFATVGLTPAGDVTGHYDHATGSLTTNPQDYTSSISLSGLLTAACTDGPFSLAFSTAKTTPFLGDAFDALGALGPPVNGVMVADWSTLPVPTGDALCGQLLSVFTTGPGGIALSNGMTPVCPGCATESTAPPATTPPPATTSNIAKRKKCLRKAKKIKDKQKRKKAIKKCKKRFR